jgi:hypothetical protein
MANKLGLWLRTWMGDSPQKPQPPSPPPPAVAPREVKQLQLELRMIFDALYGQPKK